MDERFLSRSSEARDYAREGDRWYFVFGRKSGRQLCNVPGRDEAQALRRAAKITGLDEDRLRVEKITTVGPWNGTRCEDVPDAPRKEPVLKPRPVGPAASVPTPVSRGVPTHPLLRRRVASPGPRPDPDLTTERQTASRDDDRGGLGRSRLRLQLLRDEDDDR